MTFAPSLLTAVQQYSVTSGTGEVVTGEAIPFSFSDMGVMRWPITFCAIMVAVLVARAAMRLRQGEPDQRTVARATIDGSLFWGAYALALGILGTVVGIILAAQAVEAVGQVEPRLVWGGIKVALTTTVYGFLIFLVAALAWFGLRHWHRKAVLSGA